MKNVKLLPILLCLFLVGLSPEAVAQSSRWSGECHVAFSGKSTLHNFDGEVDAEPFMVEIANFDTPLEARATSEVTVKVAKMDTGNKKRDIAMRKSLDADTYPEIVVSVKDLAPNATLPDLSGPVPEPTKIPFTLKLKGKTHKLTGKVSHWSYTDTKISYDISFPVSLSTAGVKPPSVLGVVKVNDQIDVNAHLVLNK